ncbi:Ig-like domain-containing protein [Archangium gephyra]|uniref:Ig-like domain-containing protein n=1 Tax=Archangium gephyra TaxID=48 RepID=UPI0035D4EA92
MVVRSSVNPSLAHGISSRARSCLSVALLILASCGGEPAPAPAPVAHVAIAAPATRQLERGQALQLNASALDADGQALTGRAFQWNSSNAAVAEVDAASGRVTGRGRGTVTITASSEGQSASTDFTVVILYRSVTAGELYTCDVGSGGVAECWGRNSLGVFGSGDETSSASPVRVQGGHSFAMVSSSALHGCGLTPEGKAYCWGSNSVSQLGNGTRLQAMTPVAVAGGHVFTAITVGDDHSCALTGSGQAFCWGSNSFGQLGTNTTDTELDVPTAVVGGLTFKSLSAGGDVTCGITTTHAAYCWGSDVNGNLGDGGDIAYSTTALSRVPVSVAGGHSFAQISVGRRFVCGVSVEDVGYCWGRNDVGRLGNGTEDQSAPNPIAGGLRLKQVAAGGTHGCGLATDGKAYCWGANNSGELGASFPSDLSRVPVEVSGGLLFSELAVGRNSGSAHSCGVGADRLSVWCWGRNDEGQLGNGTTATTRVDAPVAVAGQRP